MTRRPGPDGSPLFTAEVDLHEHARFRWGVRLTAADGGRLWGIFSEVDDRGSTDRYREFDVRGRDPQVEAYAPSRHRLLGAHRHGGGIRFAVWSPNARQVEVVFGGLSGYIADDAHGIDPASRPIPLQPAGGGVWEAVRPGFDDHVGRRYMYRVTRDDGAVVYRTDMYSREQCGAGAFDPRGAHYNGRAEDLDGTPSCSVVVDPDIVDGMPAVEFWADELRPDRPLPRRVEDLVIYELHVGALGYGRIAPGTFEDALAFLPHLEALGVNAVELLPIAEFNDTRSWGYGSTHFLAIENSAGGRNALQRFVKACHQRGIAVLLDLVFNHYSYDADRAAWKYDSDAHERNIYYWYEGRTTSYPFPEGGYVNNISTGFAPRYWEPQVRSLFVSSAVMLMDEFHVDGFRLDQTTSIHLYNSLNADGRAVADANLFGAKFLRELCRTLKAVNPNVILTAEDHSDWDAVTRPPDEGGLGFDARWYSDFYHHLVGDTGEGPEYAKLLETAGRGGDGPLAMSYAAGALEATGSRRVTYHENHDEAGNAQHSRRTILVAINSAPLVGETRRYAEARCRLAFGLSALSAGTPLFLMGEEVGATEKYRYDDFFEHKQDLVGMRFAQGRWLFRFYSELIRLRLGTPALRRGAITAVHVRDPERVLAFLRSSAHRTLLVVASLNNQPFDRPGYVIRHPALSGGFWREVFNSDATEYGGWGVGNRGAVLHARDGGLEVVLPACGFVIFELVADTASARRSPGVAATGECSPSFPAAI